ncbi:hypothetical protein QCB44_08575 [Thiomicrorhabdus sp. zzn3]|uniref:hypothetical protein n=1 Tax=Thiomicrorhabdus sp. zzn3 TaxID=3039775 RepID=UPI0024370478|nr:hypothetical protein [Thiomicrorhabdus sp. zzn3]MDG6778757.1 hypothetical protein [Thiomicrorhabdus sp. zzn3]
MTFLTIWPSTQTSANKLAMTFAALCFAAQTAQAGNDIETLNFDSRADFKHFADSIANVFGYKPLQPAESLGLSGFDVGASLNFAETNYKLSNQSERDRDMLPMIGVHAQKGLPGGWDVGLHYQMLSDSQASSWTGEVRYALVEGGTANPAVSLSGHFTQASGIEALSYTAYGIDLAVSKGFANLTPYAGIGWTLAKVDPKVDNLQPAVSLKTEERDLVRFAAGMNINLLVMDVLVGYNQIGELGTYSIKAGYRF